MEQYFAVGFAPDEADRQAETQFPARGFVANVEIIVDDDDPISGLAQCLGALTRQISFE